MEDRRLVPAANICGSGKARSPSDRSRSEESFLCGGGGHFLHRFTADAGRTAGCGSQVVHSGRGFVFLLGTRAQNGRYRDWDTWRKMQAAEVAVCPGMRGEELLHKTGEDRRLSLEIERIRHEIDPYLGMGWPEDPSRARRRLEIWENHVPKDRAGQPRGKGCQ